ncbi:MAG: ribbon-helix-helix domain-containing protein [Desulfobacula sp.]|uniref:ribbon-helix-helix domain-containing protein n=1 Tax=Desulfobacula sp. TaxID=2593537 RepID=UPI0025B93B3E|nr:ribbon-helix-helix domain-containing protein [Desulfobacula sp.]MCD4722847.1 ribbon-helix-helix domain-containing protein [Desulfobacula sp.]
MHTQKVAITIPKELVTMIDDISKKRGLSRSKFISMILREKIMSERNRYIKDAYDRVFSDESLRKEQRISARWFEGLGTEEGQEW